MSKKQKRHSVILSPTGSESGKAERCLNKISEISEILSPASYESGRAERVDKKKICHSVILSKE